MMRMSRIFLCATDFYYIQIPIFVFLQFYMYSTYICCETPMKYFTKSSVLDIFGRNNNGNVILALFPAHVRPPRQSSLSQSVVVLQYQVDAHRQTDIHSLFLALSLSLLHTHTEAKRPSEPIRCFFISMKWSDCGQVQVHNSSNHPNWRPLSGREKECAVR